jgi:hypothetical protein
MPRYHGDGTEADGMMNRVAAQIQLHEVHQLGTFLWPSRLQVLRSTPHTLGA